jgi:hypothetical protein
VFPDTCASMHPGLDGGGHGYGHGLLDCPRSCKQLLRHVLVGTVGLRILFTFST